VTSVCDRDASRRDCPVQELRQRGRPDRARERSQHIDSIGSLTNIQANIRRVARIRSSKSATIGAHHRHQTFLDGGMLTGSAYMRRLGA